MGGGKEELTVSALCQSKSERLVIEGAVVVWDVKKHPLLNVEGSRVNMWDVAR